MTTLPRIPKSTDAPLCSRFDLMGCDVKRAICIESVDGFKYLTIWWASSSRDKQVAIELNPDEVRALRQFLEEQYGTA